MPSRPALLRLYATRYRRVIIKTEVQHMTENTYVSVTQLARRYSVDRSTIWRWVQRGTLPQPFRLSEQTTRWKLEEIEQRDAERETAA